ncbi:hypothetical protein [Chitinophaga polysaccharea]|nr:hypothetical protein [Chitinophaga polysaccharea]
MSKVTVTEGAAIIDIYNDGSVTCLKIREAAAIDWYDYGDTCMRYYVTSPKVEAIEMATRLNEVLIRGTDEAILEEMKHFMNNFSNGEYFLNIYNNDKLTYNIVSDQVYSGATSEINYYPEDIDLLFTQPGKKISPERVAWYEAMIAAGGRPKAIVFQLDTGDYNDGAFVLDGHHKLLAYHRLRIKPTFVLILKYGEITSSSLFSDYQHFLSDYARGHIVSHHPQVLTGNSPQALLYRENLHRYLSACDDMAVPLIEVFQKVAQSKLPDEQQWLADLLEVFSHRNFVRDPVRIHFPMLPGSQYRWEIRYIKQAADFEVWVSRVTGKPWEEWKAITS